MKISLSYISDKPEMILRSCASIAQCFLGKENVTVVCAYDFCDSFRDEIEGFLEREGISSIFVKQEKEKEFSFAKQRSHSFLTCPDGPVIVCSDNYVFRAHDDSKVFPRSSEARMINCFEFLLDHEKWHAGAVMMDGSLGGSDVGYGFLYKSPFSHFATSRGIALIKRPGEIFINDSYMLPGVGEDAAVFITKFEQGYHLYKAFNSATQIKRYEKGKRLGQGYEIAGSPLEAIYKRYPQMQIPTKVGTLSKTKLLGTIKRRPRGKS